MRKPLVDAHQHFWDPARGHYPWMTDELAVIRRPFRPEDLRPLLVEAGIDYTVVVQTWSSLDETREFLALADATDFLAGVVGWVDLTDPAVGETLAQLRSGPHGRWLVGIRHQVHDEPDPDWLLRPDVQRGLRAVEEAGLVYDLLVRPRELPAALQTARAFPGLRFVIDHLAKPPIRSRDIEAWSAALEPFGPLENVSCKLSGMVTEAEWSAWTVDDLVPYVEHVVRIFGVERLLFGSDWPVCLVAATYRDVLDAARSALDRALGGLSGADLTKVFGANAIRIYRLPLSPASR